jgi:hypothetical protein
MTIVEETTWIPICCVCQQVRDDRQSHDHPAHNGFDTWMSLRSFLRLHCIPRDSYKLTHTYCERCMEQRGLDQPESEKRLGQPRVLSPQEQMRQRIVSAIGPSSKLA